MKAIKGFSKNRGVTLDRPQSERPAPGSNIPISFEQLQKRCSWQFIYYNIHTRKEKFACGVKMYEHQTHPATCKEENCGLLVLIFKD